MYILDITLPVNGTKMLLSSCYSRTIYAGETGQTRKLLGHMFAHQYHGHSIANKGYSKNIF